MSKGPRRATREGWANNAQTAWKRLKDGKADSWSLWAEMTPMLRLCRDDAMREIGLDPRLDETPTNNGRYNAAMTRALRAAKLDDVPRTDRRACIEAYPRLQDIAAYREQLRTSPHEKDRRKYLNQQTPQAVWREYRTAYGLEDKDAKPKFLDLKVRKALSLPDASVARELSLSVGDKRTYALAAGLLDSLSVPMRVAPRDSFDVPRDARHGAVINLIDKLAWEASERSRFAEALGFAGPDANEADRRLIADLRQQIAHLAAQCERLSPYDTDRAEIDEQRKANERQYKIIQDLRREKEALRARVAERKAENDELRHQSDPELVK